jgi:hypothetical protein
LISLLLYGVPENFTTARGRHGCSCGDTVQCLDLGAQPVQTLHEIFVAAVDRIDVPQD